MSEANSLLASWMPRPAWKYAGINLMGALAPGPALIVTERALPSTIIAGSWAASSSRTTMATPPDEWASETALGRWMAGAKKLLQPADAKDACSAAIVCGATR